MRIVPCLSTAMKFISPAQYSKSNQAHYLINTSAASDFLSHHPALGPEDRLLDFGCGTGETTVAMARGSLGSLGQPGQVLGVDISGEMVRHCRERHGEQGNLAFQTLNVSDAEDFCTANTGTFSMVSSFSCLHWVPDQPAAVRVFNRLLRPGGKFLFVIAGTHNPLTNLLRREYEAMRGEERWAEALRPTSWMHFATVHENTGWMTTADSRGNGYIEERDYVGLLEGQGFRVDSAKTLPLKYMLDRDFTKNFFKSTLLTAFPELQGDTRKAFFTEYIARVKGQNKPDVDGFSPAYVDGIQVFGEKTKNV